jgi:hypothetical protein
MQANANNGARLVNQAKGIYEPHYTPYALSVRQTSESPYADKEVQRRPDGSWVYRWCVRICPVLEFLLILPVLFPAILKPQHAGDFGRGILFDIRHDQRRAVVIEDLHSLMRIADCPLVNAAFNESVRCRLGIAYGLKKLGVALLPGIDGDLTHLKEIG